MALEARDRGQPLMPADRARPAVRKRLSAPAMAAFFNLAAIWRLDTRTQTALLGFPGTSTFYNYKNGTHGPLSFDVLTRISLVLGIAKALRILYPDRALADRWMNLPNANPMFAGRTPADYLAGGEIDALYRLRRFLDGRRGGWN